MNFIEMTIIEKFNFGDGRTVFAVLPVNPKAPIPASSYDLLVEDEKIMEVKIDGEMIVENQGRSPYKAISTPESSKFNGLSFESGKWKLRLNQQK